MNEIKISIVLDNQAFAEDAVGEVSRILEEIVSKIQDNGTVQCDIPLRDINGNLVGQFEYQE
jgi:hypothetical protein